MLRDFRRGSLSECDNDSCKAMLECARPPSEICRAEAVLGPALCDHRLDAAFAKCSAMWFGVVAAIGVSDIGLLKVPTTFTANRSRKG